MSPEFPEFHMRRPIIVVLVFSAFLLFASNVSADYGVWGGVIYHQASNRVFIADKPASFLGLAENLNKKILVFDTVEGGLIKTLTFEKEVSSVAVSNAGYLAVVLVVYGKDSTGQMTGESELIVLDSEYKQIASVTGVATEGAIAFYDWNDMGDKLAYISATLNPYEWASNSFKETGAWILNVIDGKSEQIANFGTAIRWSSFDGSVYVRKDMYTEEKSKVYKYDPTTKTSKLTDRFGVGFSRDGKYYVGTLFLTDDAISELIFICDDNTDIFPREGKTTLYGLGMNSFFIGNTHLLVTYNMRSVSIYDVNNLEKAKPGLIKSKKVNIVGYNKDITRLIISDGNGKFHIEDTLTGQLIKEFTIPMLN